MHFLRKNRLQTILAFLTHREDGRLVTSADSASEKFSPFKAIHTTYVTLAHRELTFHDCPTARLVQKWIELLHFA